MILQRLLTSTCPPPTPPPTTGVQPVHVTLLCLELAAGCKSQQAFIGNQPLVALILTVPRVVQRPAA